MSVIEMVENKTEYNPKVSERMRRLMEIAERDSIRRDFEIVREMHGLPPKSQEAPRKPK